MKLSLVEYQGRQDTTGRPVGHAPKVLAQYFEIVQGSFDTDIFAPECILKESEKKLSDRKAWDERKKSKNIHILPNSLTMKGKNSFSDKVLNKFRMFSNINKALKNSQADVVWFFNTEYYLMLYLAVVGNHGKKVCVTSFMEGFTAKKNGKFAGIKQKIFEKAQKKISVIIATGYGYNFKNAKSVYVPDYTYDESIYGKYIDGTCSVETDIAIPEGKYAVCLGTMNPEKQLEEMTEAFSRIGYPLVVAGRFYDKERLERLRDMAADNVTFIDSYLSVDEYYTLLAKAEYTVLPYSPEQYSTQTSGVLQESVFCGTIPVSYSRVLDGNRVKGVGFENFDKLRPEDLEITSEKRQEYLDEYARLRRDVYDKNKIENDLREALAGCV
ncbi:MAG: hypothetical protein IKO53_04740 [Lachnospiraceae bacterium]|nr:hypothetical protein [Lachnospiraceae bacterium]